jgi:hypothetical protein
MMLAAFEATMRQNAKDEAEWTRTYASFTAEPKEVREARRAAEAAGARTEGRGRMSVGDAEAMLARFTASEASYG